MSSVLAAFRRGLGPVGSTRRDSRDFCEDGSCTSEAGSSRGGSSRYQARARQERRLHNRASFTRKAGCLPREETWQRGLKKWSPERVLVVDDDDDSLRIAVRCVWAAWPQAEIATAFSASAAIETIGTQDFDFILTDVRMPPPGNGFDVAAIARSRGLPCVAVSAHKLTIPSIATLEKDRLTPETLRRSAEVARMGCPCEAESLTLAMRSSR